jgi:hypothetical protein
MKKFISSVWIRIGVAFVTVALTACGGGGGGGGDGGGSGSGVGHAPAISNLQYSPDSSFVNNGGGTVFVNASVDFSDADGDLVSYALDIYDSSNVLVDSLSGATAGVAGITAGTVNAALSVNTTVADDYKFLLYLTDASGNESNQLTGGFPIYGPVQTTSTLPDTDVSKCYNQSAAIDCPIEGQAFYGQDYQYTSNEMRFTDNGDSTVTDNVTSLTWQQGASASTYNWYEASGTFDATHNPGSVDVCGSLSFVGHTDWRLPSRRELESIVDYGTGIPAAINTTYFPSGNGEYWSDAEDAPSAADARFADFTDGSVRVADKITTRFVRCARGSAWGSSVFVDNGDNTVTDTPLGLTWQKAGQGSLDWDAMLAFCEGLSLAGQTDWRLPDIKELVTLVGAESALTIQPGVYCSSSTVADDQDSAWLVQFHPTSNYGDVFNHGAGTSKNFCSSFYFRCVR